MVEFSIYLNRRVLEMTAADNVLPIKCPTCTGKVPPFIELVSYGTPTLRSGGTNQYFSHVFVSDGVTLTISEMVLWGTLQANFMEEYLFPKVRGGKTQESFKTDSKGSLYHACFLVILGPTLLSSSLNTSWGMPRKLVNDAGSSLWSSTIN